MKSKKKNPQHDHYRNVPESLKQRTPKPKFGLNNPHLTAAIAPTGFSAFVPGSFVNQPQMNVNQEGLFSKLLKKTSSIFGKHKFKLAYVFLAVIAIAGLAYFALYYQPIQTMIAATNKFANSDFSETNQAEWAQAVNDFRFIDPPEPLQGAEEGAFSRSLMSYVNSFETFNKSNHLELPSIEILEAKETQIDLDEPLITEDKNYQQGFSYSVEGRDFSFEKYMSCKLKFSDKESPEINFLIAKVTTKLGDTEVKGLASLDEVISILNSNLTSIKEDLKNKDATNLALKLFGTDVDQIEPLIELDPELKKLSKLKVFGNITVDSSDFQSGNVVFVGKIDTTNDGKKKLGELKVYYNTIKHEYLFDGLFTLIPNLPDASIIVTPTDTSSNSNVTILECSDCWLAPVDKSHQLKASYSPKVSATGLNGGGSMIVQASAALKDLFTAAEAENVKARVISSYRSYGEQVNTFNYWTQKVLASNPSLSRAEAEVKANVFSARPGQSEHQLGTTVDLKCATCGDFDNSAGNIALYNFLEANAHKFGFAISYAKDTQQYTGYKYEPWHIRYIGTELATALYNTGYLNSNGNYLAKFLLERNLY